jgi:hypothetical protein
MASEVVACNEGLDACLGVGGKGLEQFVDENIVGDFREHLRIMQLGNGGREGGAMTMKKVGVEGRTATVEMRGERKEEVVRVWERREGERGGWMLIHYSLRMGV